MGSERTPPERGPAEKRFAILSILLFFASTQMFGIARATLPMGWAFVVSGAVFVVAQLLISIPMFRIVRSENKKAAAEKDI